MIVELSVSGNKVMEQNYNLVIREILQTEECSKDLGRLSQLEIALSII